MPGSYAELERIRKEKAERARLAAVPTPTLAPAPVPAEAPPAKGAPPVEGRPPEAPAREEAAPARSPEPVLPGAAPGKGAPPAEGRVTAPPRKGAPPVEGRVLIASPHSRLPHEIIDQLWPTLDQPMQSVYMVLFRLSWGFGKPRCKIGLRKLAERTGLSLNPTRSATRRLEQRGLVRNVGVDNTSSSATDRGIEWEVKLPDGVEVAQGAPPGKGAPPAAVPPPGKGAPPAEGSYKHEKENDKAGVYEIRVVAARLFEAHRSELGFDRERLRRLVVDALIGNGVSVDEAVVDEAIRGMV